MRIILVVVCALLTFVAPGRAATLDESVQFLNSKAYNAKDSITRVDIWRGPKSGAYYLRMQSGPAPIRMVLLAQAAALSSNLVTRSQLSVDTRETIHLGCKGGSLCWYMYMKLDNRFEPVDSEGPFACVKGYGNDCVSAFKNILRILRADESQPIANPGDF